MASYYHRETVFYDKCHHFGNDNIENDKCLKRYFDITEAHSDIVKRLIVCNEFIRLKISSTNIQSVINNKYGESIYFDRANYRHIIDDMVHEVFPPKHPLSCMETNMHRSIMNPVFDYVICERPYLMRGISLNDALRLILDYGWDNVFARGVEAFALKGDLVLGISTSGNSSNIIKALETAKRKECFTASLLGKEGGKLKGSCDYEIIVPSDNTARIQEIHGIIIHLLIELIEYELFTNPKENPQSKLCC